MYKERFPTVVAKFLFLFYLYFFVLFRLYLERSIFREMSLPQYFRSHQPLRSAQRRSPPPSHMADTPIPPHPPPPTSKKYEINVFFSSFAAASNIFTRNVATLPRQQSSNQIKNKRIKSVSVFFLWWREVAFGRQKVRPLASCQMRRWFESCRVESI